MPPITRTYVKTSLAWFVLALLAGLIETTGWPVSVPGLQAVYIHLLVVGWLTQLIFGVATWMFPKFSRGQPRGPEWLLWTVYGLLNGGLLLRAVGEPLLAARPSGLAGSLLAISAVLQLAAGWIYVGLLWPRVRER